VTCYVARTEDFYESLIVREKSVPGRSEIHDDAAATEMRGRTHRHTYTVLKQRHKCFTVLQAATSRR
jgi:hypothetical protein